MKLHISIIIFLYLLLSPIGSTAEKNTEKSVEVITENKNGAVLFICKNNTISKVTLTLELKLENSFCNKTLPKAISVAPKKKILLCSIKPKNKKHKWFYKYHYFWKYGTFKAKHESSYVYSLPYQSGSKFKISQGYTGTFSHFGDDLNCLDWTMPTGTPICAIRDGKIIETKDDSNESGLTDEYKDKGNFILIEHSDKTIAHYVHLKYKGIKVKRGQKVKAGQVIGLSGNTGRSTEPHLHLSVFKPITGKNRENFKIKFSCIEGNGILLDEGNYYTAK